jgi:hypothetical protein
VCNRTSAQPRTPLRAVHTDTAYHASEQPQQSSSAACRQQLQQHLADLERVLPTLTCSQLANTVSSLALTYQAANLSCEAGAGPSSIHQLAGPGAAADPHAIVEFYTETFPDQSFLLTFRDTVGQYLAQHPASFTAAAAAGVEAGESQQSDAACSACNPAQLAKILAAIASLPIMVVQPLPIGKILTSLQTLDAILPASTVSCNACARADVTSTLEPSHCCKPFTTPLHSRLYNNVTEAPHTKHSKPDCPPQGVKYWL